MKSILVSENKMYITSFGKGNSAVLEYEVDKVDNNNYNKTQLSSKDNSNIELGDVNEVNITFSRYPPNNPPFPKTKDPRVQTRGSISR